MARDALSYSAAKSLRPTATETTDKEATFVRHLRIALYDMTSGTADDVMDLARREMIPLYEAQPGFVRYEVGTLDSGGIVSFSIWETEAEAVRAEELAADWVVENVANRVKLREEHTGNIAWDEAL